MGGDDSQKLRPWRGPHLLSGAHQTSGSQQITVTKTAMGFSRAPLPRPARSVVQLQTAWVTFGKQTWVTSRKRRRKVRPLQNRATRVTAAAR
jgi:hypothetical protein